MQRQSLQRYPESLKTASRLSENGELDSVFCRGGVACGHGVYRGSCARSGAAATGIGCGAGTTDSPVRFIDAFVDDLDLGQAGFHRSRPKATGRPGYDPGDMLKLYLYGYLNRVRSSRRLEAEATRNPELIWLLRGLRPDVRTIADFRRDNRAALKAVFRAFAMLCRKLDLFGRELLAIDRTRLKAVNNPGRNFSRDKLARYIAAADERLKGYLAEPDAIDRGEALAAKIARVRKRRQAREAMLGQLNASGESQISLTDPDARAMVTGQKTTVGYNAQVAVDAKHKLIVEQQDLLQTAGLGRRAGLG